MPDDTLLVPTVLTSGTVHFATVAATSTAKDVIDALVSSNEVKEEALGGLEETSWDLQRVRVARSGRPWEEYDLEALGECESRSTSSLQAA